MFVGRFIFDGGQSLNSEPCIYYALPKPAKLNSRGHVC